MYNNFQLIKNIMASKEKIIKIEMKFEDYIPNTFISPIAIGDRVSFEPMFRHCEMYCIAQSSGFGRVVAIKFTKAKVFYDIVDEYWGYLFDCVASENVKLSKN